MRKTPKETEALSKKLSIKYDTLAEQAVNREIPLEEFKKLTKEIIKKTSSLYKDGKQKINGWSEKQSRKWYTDDQKQIENIILANNKPAPLTAKGKINVINSRNGASTCVCAEVSAAAIGMGEQQLTRLNKITPPTDGAKTEELAAKQTSGTTTIQYTNLLQQVLKDMGDKDKKEITAILDRLGLPTEKNIINTDNDVNLNESDILTEMLIIKKLWEHIKSLKERSIKKIIIYSLGTDSYIGSLPCCLVPGSHRLRKESFDAITNKLFAIAKNNHAEVITLLEGGYSTEDLEILRKQINIIKEKERSFIVAALPNHHADGISKPSGFCLMNKVTIAEYFASHFSITATIFGIDVHLDNGTMKKILPSTRHIQIAEVKSGFYPIPKKGKFNPEQYCNKKTAKNTHIFPLGGNPKDDKMAAITPCEEPGIAKDLCDLLTPYGLYQRCPKPTGPSKKRKRGPSPGGEQSF